MSLFEPGRPYGTIGTGTPDFSWDSTEESALPETTSTARSSLAWYFSIVTLVLMVLALRLITLQVTEASSRQLLAEGNRIRNRVIQPPRGLITDRHGQVLAKNVAEFAVELLPADLPKDGAERQLSYERASTALGLDLAPLVAQVDQQGLFSLDPILLAEHLSHEAALLLKVKLRDTPGIRVVERPRREYVPVPSLAHLLGYTGQVSQADLDQSDRYTHTSRVGKTGVEVQYELLLQGQQGVEQIEVDSRGYLQRVVGTSPPMSGDTLVLAIDRALQEKLEEALRRTMEQVGSTAGAAVIEDPRDGSLRALVSLPTYDPNEFAAGISQERYQELLNDPGKLFTNRAIAGSYPSGSVIKPVIAAAGLADGVITESTTINAPGQIEVGEFVFPDWKVHGVVDVKKAIAVSSNVFFYAVGGGWDKIRGLGVQRLTHYLDRFGFGRLTGIDLPGEVEGLIPTPEWKEEAKGEPWYLGDTYHLAIGQGDLLVTPLQLANATATIANGGTVQTPHLFLRHESVQPTDVVTAPPQPHGSIDLDPYQLSVVRGGMRQAVESGSARRLQSLPVTSAGKTGTAQFGTRPEGSEDLPTHAWFTAFAPYENPELVITVLIEGGGAGNEIALPVAEEVLQWHYSRPEEERS